MGIASNGPHGDHRGKIGNIVYYMLNGKNVSRTIGVNTKPPTERQLKARMETKLVSKLFSNLLEFVNIGFGIEKLGTDKNAFNLAMEYNRTQIVKGVYPNLEIAYDKVILSKGLLKPAENPQMKQVPSGLQFNWDTHPRMSWPEVADQVMLLAYFPEENIIASTLFGSSRESGHAELEISEDMQDKYMEIYISFIAADRKQVSNSSYIGSLNAPKTSAQLTLNS